MTAIVLGHTYGVPVSGTAMALDPMLTVQRERAADWAEARLWGRTSHVPTVGNRRMAAVGVNGVTFHPGHKPDGTLYYAI